MVHQELNNLKDRHSKLNFRGKEFIQTNPSTNLVYKGFWSTVLVLTENQEDLFSVAVGALLVSVIYRLYSYNICGGDAWCMQAFLCHK